jgi:hypothetical protein
MVRKREGQFDLESVREELNRRIGTIFAKQRLVCCPRDMKAKTLNLFQD